MFKKAARFQQRLGTMIGSGMFTRDPLPVDDRGKHLSPVEQAHLKSRQRLARIRRAFELEAEISEKLGRGDNVGALREELAKVKSGEVKVSLTLANDPRPSREVVGITLARKTGPAVAPFNVKNDRGRERPSSLSVGMVEGALQDLARSKLTPNGIGIVKVMLDQFEIATVGEALGISNSFLEKLKNSPVYGLASPISARDALVIVDVLDKRLVEEAGATQADSRAAEDNIPIVLANAEGGASVEHEEEAAPVGPEADAPDIFPRARITLRTSSVEKSPERERKVPTIKLSRKAALPRRKPAAAYSARSPSHLELDQSVPPISYQDTTLDPQVDASTLPYHPRLEKLNDRRTRLKVSLQRGLESIRAIEHEIEELDKDIADLSSTD